MMKSVATAASTFEPMPTTKQVELTMPMDEKTCVKWEANDKENPHCWSHVYRALCTFQLGMLAFAASFASSIISPANEVIASEFSISVEVAALDISLFVLGLALGPLLWAGLSETYGRRISLLPATFIFGLFSIGTACSQSITSLFITRFFAGVFGSAPVSNVVAAIGDLYPPKSRGVAVSFYSLTVVGGPTLGPVIGAALTVKASWRWTQYLTAILVFVLVSINAFTLPETYSPVLLKRRAEMLRKTTGNPALYHPHEHVKLDLRSMITKHFSRPLRMLLTEPIVTVIVLYASFVFALLYMALEIFTLIFRDLRGWPLISSQLPFLAMFTGITSALTVNLGNAYFYNRAVDRAGGKAVPEARLPPICIGSVLFCAGLFWLGWTATPTHHWILPVLAIGMIGAGFSCIFQQCLLFLVDTYKLYAASATSANTFVRSIFAAGLPLAIRPMFKAIGVADSLSILGAVAAAAIPMPWLLIKYSASLRSRSHFAAKE